MATLNPGPSLGEGEGKGEGVGTPGKGNGKGPNAEELKKPKTSAGASKDEGMKEKKKKKRKANADSNEAKEEKVPKRQKKAPAQEEGDHSHDDGSWLDDANWVAERVAREVDVGVVQVKAAVALMDNGDSVPFIARYRKEKTGGLDDTQLRTLESRLLHWKEFGARKRTILRQLEKIDRLTPELKAQVMASTTKAHLEDLYAPHCPKRKNKATEALNAGFGPLAEEILRQPNKSSQAIASQHVQALGCSVDTALVSVGHILTEKFCGNADLNAKCLQLVLQKGIIRSRAITTKCTADGANNYKAFFDWTGRPSVAGFRMLAIFRGAAAGFLRVSVEVPEDIIRLWMGNTFRIPHTTSGTLQICVAAAVKKLSQRLQKEVLQHVRERAEGEAIRVFSTNMKDVLMHPPAGPVTTMGLDPGIGSGTKVAVIHATGRLLELAVVRAEQQGECVAKLLDLCKVHEVELLSLGNGTGSRPMESIVRDCLAKNAKLSYSRTSECGASVYSASETAAAEFPDVDVIYRGAISIAKRLQDPLSEYVKVPPKSLGVGQYQHDVNQNALGTALENVVHDCVNAVGVHVNTSSVHLLKYVSGLNLSRATKIVAHRQAKGPFRSRQDLMKVSGIGPKTFEQAIAFLRIPKASNPLDYSGVHPESYGLVERIAKAYTQSSIETLIGNQDILQRIDPMEFVDANTGQATVTDILNELAQPGRDPRPPFQPVQFSPDVHQLKDCKVGMALPGVVTNVTEFGAFVDVGVHSEGLLHTSKFGGKMPHVGQALLVKVLEVDVARNRLSLAMA